MADRPKRKPKFDVGQVVFIEGLDARLMRIAEMRVKTYIEVDFYYRRWHTDEWFRESQLRPLTKRECGRGRANGR